MRASLTERFCRKDLWRERKGKNLIRCTVSLYVLLECHERMRMKHVNIYVAQPVLPKKPQKTKTEQNTKNPRIWVRTAGMTWADWGMCSSTAGCYMFYMLWEIIRGTYTFNSHEGHFSSSLLIPSGSGFNFHSWNKQLK